jgi:hypothetical protein
MRECELISSTNPSLILHKLLQVVHVALESEAVLNLLLKPSFVIVQSVDMLGQHPTQLPHPDMMCLLRCVASICMAMPCARDFIDPDGWRGLAPFQRGSSS